MDFNHLLIHSSITVPTRGSLYKILKIYKPSLSNTSSTKLLTTDRTHLSPKGPINTQFIHSNSRITLFPFYIGPPIPIRELSIPSNKPTTTKPSQIMLHIIIQDHKLLRRNKRKTGYISNSMTYLS